MIVQIEKHMAHKVLITSGYFKAEVDSVGDVMYLFECEGSSPPAMLRDWFPKSRYDLEESFDRYLNFLAGYENEDGD